MSSHPLPWGYTPETKKLEENDQLKNRVSKLKSRIGHILNMDNRIDQRVAVLALELNKLLEIRYRRFCTFKKDILKDILVTDSKIIPYGNEVAHGGDFLTHVELDERGMRFDDGVFNHNVCVTIYKDQDIR